MNHEIQEVESRWTAKDYSDAEVALALAMVKIARAKSSINADNYIDLAGYAACAGELAAMEQQERKEEGLEKDLSFQLMQGDCLELMRQIPDSSVDLVLTDPPYNGGNKAQIKGKRAKFEWDYRENYTDWCIKWFLECQRVPDFTGSAILLA